MAITTLMSNIWFFVLTKPNANDGNTLRHEAFHHVQACAASKRGQSYSTVLQDITGAKSFVASAS